MLQVYFVVGVTLSAVTTTKNFSEMESALSYIVDFLTRNASGTAAINVVSRYQDNLTTTYCDHILGTLTITLAGLRTCP